jgi:hypothetical protein
MPRCIEWGQERHEECSATEDRGYNECAASEDRGYRDCCDWAPCSWFCRAWVWVSNIVCVAWTWVSNIVCVAWTWITTAICVVWDAITTAINAILVTLESILGWVLSAIAFIVELLEAIPILGTLIRWILNGLTYIGALVGSLVDAGLGLIGIRPEKLLRVCTVILKDENGNPVSTKADVVTMLQLASDIYKRDVNVRILPLKPFKYSTGFSNAETVDESWVQIDGNNGDSDTLDVPCDAGGDWLLNGSKFQWKVSTLCFFGSWRRVLGYGSPVTVFIMRSTPGVLGCGLGIVDYVTIASATTFPDGLDQSPRTIGHEIGHACMLLHTCVDDGISNLMATGGACSPTSNIEPNRFTPIIADWQALIIRASKHVSYF